MKKSTNNFLKNIPGISELCVCTDESCNGVCPACYSSKQWLNIPLSFIAQKVLPSPTVKAKSFEQFLKDQSLDMTSGFITKKIMRSSHYQQLLKKTPFACTNSECKGVCTHCKYTYTAINTILGFAINSVLNSGYDFAESKILAKLKDDAIENPTLKTEKVKKP